MKTFAWIAYVMSLAAFGYVAISGGGPAEIKPGTVAILSLATATIILVGLIATGYKPNALMWPLAAAGLFVAKAAATPSPNQDGLWMVTVVITYTVLLLTSDPEVRVEPAKAPPVSVAPASRSRRGIFG